MPCTFTHPSLCRGSGEILHLVCSLLGFMLVGRGFHLGSRNKNAPSCPRRVEREGLGAKVRGFITALVITAHFEFPNSVSKARRRRGDFYSTSFLATTGVLSGGLWNEQIYPTTSVICLGISSHFVWGSLSVGSPFCCITVVIFHSLVLIGEFASKQIGFA